VNPYVAHIAKVILFIVSISGLCYIESIDLDTIILYEKYQSFWYSFGYLLTAEFGGTPLNE